MTRIEGLGPTGGPATQEEEEEGLGPMTLELAIELGKTDNEANWDHPQRMQAYRIRMEARRKPMGAS
jgi:hypothetical protein